ncbi:MAG: threonine synthase [Candidatus Diapherotrites archaeon]
MHAKNFVCFKCGREYSMEPVLFECPSCNYSLDIEYNYSELRKLVKRYEFLNDQIRHWKYWMFYPIKDLSKIVSLQEGGTPLIHSNKIRDYHFKFEGSNPTGSFKDRGSTVEVSKALELGVKEIACASTGNMGASIAAYSAKAGINATIFVPGFATKEKFAQISAHGARIVRVKGSYDDAVKKTKQLKKKRNVYLMGDYPFRGEGEKSIAFEVIEQLNYEVPDFIVSPIGNGTLIYSVFKGLNEFRKAGLIKKIPRIVGVQVNKCSPVVKAWKNNLKEILVIKNFSTIATAIACGNPVDGLEALHAIKASKGLAEEVTEKEILSAQKELGKEGLYAEPSGAVSFAGAKKLGLKGRVACIVTGHGLKDTKKYS